MASRGWWIAGATLAVGALLVAGWAYTRVPILGEAHEVDVPADEPFQLERAWSGVVHLPAAWRGPAVAHVVMSYDGTGTTGWPDAPRDGIAGGLEVRVIVRVNGEVVEDRTDVFSTGGRFDVVRMPKFSDSWRVWGNVVDVHASVQNEPIDGVAGRYHLTLGPVRIDTKAPAGAMVQVEA